MSTNATKIQLHDAVEHARSFRNLFTLDMYEQWEIAGSIRRGKPLVGDIEHVVIPAFGDVDVGGSLFPDYRRVNLLWHRLDELLAAGRVEKALYGDGPTPRTKWGDRSRGVSVSGVTHDLYTADADNWGSVLAIRTGPGGYSKMLVNALQRNGCWNNGGYVWKKTEIACRCGWSGGYMDAKFAAPEPGDPTPKFTNGHDQAVLCPRCGLGDGIEMPRIPVPEERDYFRLCNVPWTEPADRRDPEVRP
jgi:DNA polymerase/3'-5' exonuclease PolX